MSADHDLDARQDAPPARRNRAPILAGLQPLLPVSGRMLEIASGTGQHAAYLAPRLPGWVWQPTEYDPDRMASIAAWCAPWMPDKIKPPMPLDTTDTDWPLGAVEAMFCANMIHIAPWAVAEGLFAGAGRHLTPDGLLILYGPFMRDGVHNAPSNAEFDRSLKARDPAWGIRDLTEIDALARSQGLAPGGERAMPANNRLVWFHRAN